MKKLICFFINNLELIISGLSFIFSIIAIYISFINSKKLNDREKQKELYERFLNCIKKIENNQMYMFDKKYIDELLDFRIAFQINASKKVNMEYIKISKLFEDELKKYFDYYNSIDPYRDDNIVEEYEDGVCIGTYLIDNSITDEMFCYELDEYRKKHVYSKEKVNKILSKLYKNMKKDLK